MTPRCEPHCPGTTHGLAGPALLMAACAMSVGCATLMGSPKQTNIDNPNQVEALSRAQVWQPTNVESMDVRQGPRDGGAFAPMATVNCRHVEKDATGKTPKFACVVGGDELKVKYGRDNGEIYAEVAASRLLWALGFGADRVYPVRVDLRWLPRVTEGGQPATGWPRRIRVRDDRPRGRRLPCPRIRGIGMGLAGPGSREPGGRWGPEGAPRCADAARGTVAAHRQQARAAALHLPRPAGTRGGRTATPANGPSS